MNANVSSTAHMRFKRVYSDILNRKGQGNLHLCGYHCTFAVYLAICVDPHICFSAIKYWLKLAVVNCLNTTQPFCLCSDFADTKTDLEVRCTQCEYNLIVIVGNSNF